MTAALAAPAAAQAAPRSAEAPTPSRSVSAAARLQTRAVVDSRKAARSAGKSPARARALVERSGKRLMRAYSITLNATANSGADVGGFQSAAGAAASFSSASTKQTTALLSVVDNAGGSLDQAAATAVDNSSSMQGHVALSLAASAQGVNGSAEATAVGALRRLISGQGTVTVNVVDQAGSGMQSPTVTASLAATVAESTQAQADLTAKVLDLSATLSGGASATAQAQATTLAHQLTTIADAVSGSDVASVTVHERGSATTTLGSLTLGHARSAQAIVRGGPASADDVSIAGGAPR